MPYLEVLNGPEVGFKALISQDTFFIGRDPNNHLVLTDRTVSRKHAVINQMDGKFVISDLKSLKGLLINGSKLNEASLEDGDEIAVGAVRLHFYANDDGKVVAAMQPKKSRGLWIALALALITALAGGYYFWTHEVTEIEKHYLLGVELFNENHDIDGATREWRKVLELDPDRKSPYAKKAAKLLDFYRNP